MIFLNIKNVHNSLNSLELLTQSNPPVTASHRTVTRAVGFVFLQNLGHFSFEFLIVTKIQGGPMYSLTSLSLSIERG